MGDQSSGIKNVVVVGGGTAGWLTACVIGAEFESGSDGISVTLVESPDTPTIGVGEGTWPSMRSTLKKIGISETTLLRQCGASLKQGTHFKQWQYQRDNDCYYHPFTEPKGFGELNIAEHWLSRANREEPFAHTVTAQSMLCDLDSAPKQLGVPEYSYILNYGYHLDAGRFANLLAEHATKNLNVLHLQAHINEVLSGDDGDVIGLRARTGEVIAGDLFIDCTGFESLLLSNHYNIPLIPVSKYLFNDRAIAVQVPYENGAQAINSTTLSTAQRAGWIWDIGLRDRRGVGYVHSQEHTNGDEAFQDLNKYLLATGRRGGLKGLEPRVINFRSGYRETFWHKNCVAVGLSAGFVEPLEASALVLIELSARAIADNLPRDRSVMPTIAARFNDNFRSRWEQIVDFLKLHYVLSKREDSAYWLENRAESSIPTRLLEKLADWRYRAPWHIDQRQTDELFPAASYQYVLYGMGFETTVRTDRRLRQQELDRADQLLAEVKEEGIKLMQHLPTNRVLLQQIYERAFAG